MNSYRTFLAFALASALFAAFAANANDETQ